MSQIRQLAAIMFTDIVGYTALMGRDEQKAFQLLTKNREIQRPIIEQFNGRWIKELGDGILASFSTVTDAVNAATSIQEACNAVNDFTLRIGIHLGEVVFENEDVFGDGVNIASRIQASARPGSIYISESVHQNVSNKKEFKTRFVKEEPLKNVKEPVKMYEVMATKNQQPVSFSEKEEPSSTNISPKSIAVLPFVNMSSDPEQDYFSDGITEDIITHISKIHELKVISRTSVTQYKNTKKSLVEIAVELRVSYLLEGSVRKAGNRLRIVVQLLDAGKDEHIWAETYDRDMTDIFAIQTEIARHVASGLMARLTTNEIKRISRKPTANLEAYNLYLFGRSHYHKATPGDFTKAIEYYQKAITLDPGFALAYAALAVVMLYQGAGYFGTRPNEIMPEAFKYAEKALELDPNLSEAYTARAELYDWYYFDWTKAGEDYRLALTLNPSNASAHLYYAYHLVIRRQLEHAMAEREQALELDPYSILIRFNAFQIPMFAGMTRQSLEEVQSSTFLFETAPLHAYHSQGIFTAQLGLSNESVTALKEAYRISGKLTLSKIWLSYGLARAGNKEEARFLLTELHELEKREFVWPLGIALAYAHLGETEKSLDYLEKSYEERVGMMLFISCEPAWDILRKEPRFTELIRKIGPPEAITELAAF